VNGVRLSHRMTAEAIGAFAIVFFGCGAIMVAQRFSGSISGAAIPVVFGLVVAAMIYTLGHISGAHFNPAVTLAFAVSRHFPARDVAAYWLAQCAGALLATAILSLILPNGHSYGATVPSVSSIAACAWEAILTFFLMLVIMGVATDTRAIGTMAGAAIGATVMLDAFIGGPITGASMNPVRSLAPAIAEGRMDVLWIYILSPMIGAIVASLLYQWMRGERAVIAAGP
jgi:MIP family channel proteins